MRRFLYHFHGLGAYDFSDMRPSDLPGLAELAESRDVDILPTIYLRRERLAALEELAQALTEHKHSEELPRIAGLAVEGPLLGPAGGIPRAGKWYPTADEWMRLAALGDCGLRYMVMAPDAVALDEDVDAGLTFGRLILELYSHGARLALGHFYRDNPQRSAERIADVLELVHSRYTSSPYLVLTDHLYNDMPRSFTHAYRTADEMARRDEEVRGLLDAEWSPDTLPSLLGPVPAALLDAALRDLLAPCINFDGQHVDLEIVARTLDYLGSDRLIALTDHTESTVMAGESLTMDARTGLLLRDDGAVAAGSCGPDQAAENMRSIGMSDSDVDAVFYRNPLAAISHQPLHRE